NAVQIGTEPSPVGEGRVGAASWQDSPGAPTPTLPHGGRELSVNGIPPRAGSVAFSPAVLGRGGGQGAIPGPSEGAVQWPPGGAASASASAGPQEPRAYGSGPPCRSHERMSGSTICHARSISSGPGKTEWPPSSTSVKTFW